MGRTGISMLFHAESSALRGRIGELQRRDHRVQPAAGRCRTQLVPQTSGGVRDGVMGPEMGLEGLCAFS